MRLPIACLSQNQNRVLYCLLLFLGVHTSVLPHTLSGKITDDQAQPLDLATVGLFQLPDSILVKAEVTDQNGYFLFTDIPPGRYYLRIRYAGFQELIRSDIEVLEGQLPVHLGELGLQVGDVQLSEVRVTASRPFVERQSDRLIINVDNSLLSAGANAFELLERAPGVIVGANDALSIRGRTGVIFMIDGKVTPMSGQELVSYLSGLPAGSIDRIEIITNPSARYDAAGNAGIIDIRMKKDGREGTNGSLNASLGQGVYPKAGGGVMLNHRHARTNVFGSYQYNFREMFNDLRLHRTFLEDGQPVGAYAQRNYMVVPLHLHMLRAGIDYALSSNSILGLVATGHVNRVDRQGNNFSRVEDGQGWPISQFGTQHQSEESSPSLAVNINFKRTFPKTRQEFTLDVDGARYRTDTDQEFLTRYSDLQGQELQAPYLLTGDMRGELDIQSVKADYLIPIGEKSRLEAGVKASRVTADNNLRFVDESVPEQPVVDTTISNHFLYEEQIRAAYINVHHAWTKLSLQAGLRAEQTLAEGRQVVREASFNRRYVNLFPSVFLQYNFSDNYSMGLNLSRRLDRPSYQQLNPFRYFLDPSTYREGNPLLNPQFTWSAEWHHTFLQRFTASFSYALTTDNITQVIAPVEGLDRVTVQTDQNLDRAEYLSFNVHAPVSPFSWWDISTDLAVYAGRYLGNYASTALDDGNVVVDVRTRHQVKLSPDWSAELGVSYHSREQYAFMDLNPRWGMSAGIQKLLFDRKASIKLSLSDIFWTNLPAAFIRFRDYEETFDVFRETRMATLAYTHRFGDSKLAPSRRRSGGAEDEKRRAGGGGADG